MKKRQIASGETFGLLKVIREVEPFVSDTGNSYRQFEFECKCGEVFTRTIAPVLEGRVVSCGCYNKQKGLKHGLSNTRIYKVWTGMCQRCYNPASSKYELYGGRGISVCPEWKESPELFVEWALKNGYRDGMTIDRKDGDGNYDPGNCRIVDYEVQNNNTSRNRHLEAFKERKTIAEWSRDKRCKVGVETLRARVKRGGWTNEECISTPSIDNAHRHLKRGGRAEDLGVCIADSERSFQGDRDGLNFDVETVAKQYGGGGHPNAAGFSFSVNAED